MRQCFYCRRKAHTFHLSELTPLIQKAFEDHFQRTSTEPSSFEYALSRDSLYDWEREGTLVADLIEEMVQVPFQAAEDLRQILDEETFSWEVNGEMGEEAPFDIEAQYEEQGVNGIDFHVQWSSLEKGLRSQARFFNDSAKKILDIVFHGIEKMRTREGLPVIVAGGPDTQFSALYRARVFDNEKKLEEALKNPEREIGTPPSAAANSGRMNARGISVFYGATDDATAIAEVRPPVGSRVAVAKFEIIKPLRLLDLQALESLIVKGSYFDPKYLKKLERADFLRVLSHRMTKPVMNADEISEYLITQVIAEYLASEKQLDGIIYRSVQVAGEVSNVVLFHQASGVERIALPKNTKLTASSYSHGEDEEIEYRVWEEKEPNKGPTTDLLWDDFGPDDYQQLPDVPDSLRIDLEDVKVHEVRAVKFTTTPYTVHRHRLPVTEEGEPADDVSFF